MKCWNGVKQPSQWVTPRLTYLGGIHVIVPSRDHLSEYYVACYRDCLLEKIWLYVSSQCILVASIAGFLWILVWFPVELLYISQESLNYCHALIYATTQLMWQKILIQWFICGTCKQGLLERYERQSKGSRSLICLDMKSGSSTPFYLY